jgi:hypothetical protein
MVVKVRRWGTAVLAASCAFGMLTHGNLALAEPRTHDGFYLQLATGAGFVHASAEVTTLVLRYEDGPYEPSTGTITYSGISAPFSLLLGGTLGRSLVIGGGVFNDYVPVANEKVRIYGTGGNDPDFSMSLLGIGAFADIYFNPRSGLHLQPFVGYSWLVLDDEVRSQSLGGPVFAVGFGHDWWVGSEWSIGILGRFAVAPLTYNETTFFTLAPAILATFTYH